MMHLCYVMIMFDMMFWLLFEKDTIVVVYIDVLHHGLVRRVPVMCVQHIGRFLLIVRAVVATVAVTHATHASIFGISVARITPFGGRVLECLQSTTAVAVLHVMETEGPSL